MPPVQFDVQLSFDLGSVSDWVQAIAAVFSLAFAAALLVVTERQRRIGVQANSIAERQTGLLDKQAAIAERQAAIVLRQGEIAMELDRGRLTRVEARATSDMWYKLKYRNVGRSSLDLLGWVFWDFGPLKAPEVDPVNEWVSVGQEMIAPGGEYEWRWQIMNPKGLTRLKIYGDEDTFRIAVLVFYSTLGELRAYRQAWVFRADPNSKGEYVGERHVGFERDGPADMEEFNRLMSFAGHRPRFM